MRRLRKQITEAEERLLEFRRKAKIVHRGEEREEKCMGVLLRGRAC